MLLLSGVVEQAAVGGYGVERYVRATEAQAYAVEEIAIVSFVGALYAVE